MNARMLLNVIGCLSLAPLLLTVTTGCEPQKPELASSEYAPVLEKVHTVAVLPFVDAPGEGTKGSGLTVVNATIAAMYQCPGMSVIERGRLDAIANEHDLKIHTQINEADATRLGKLAGAEAIILGEVTQYEAQQEYGHFAVDVVSAGSTKRFHRVGLSIRVVNVADSRVIYANLGQGVSEQGYSEAAKAAAQEAFKSWKQFYEYTRATKK